jgi:hypothetical protein
MFKRVLVEDWTLCLPYIAFFITAAVFILVTVCALCMRKSVRSRLASLPLDDSASSRKLPENDN